MPRDSARPRLGRKIKFFALLSALAIGASVMAASAAHAGGPPSTTIFINSTLSPDTVPSGGSVLWHLDVSTGETSVNLNNVEVHLSISDGSFDLSATSNVNGKSLCKKETPTPSFAAAAVTPNIVCKIGDLPANGEISFGVVVSTTGVPAPETIFGDAFAQDETGASTGSDSVQIHVVAANPDSNTGYVAPGKTISVGPKNPNSTTDPTVGSFSLPKKELIVPPTFAAAAAPKPVPGPGAVITISADDPTTEPTACGGEQCQGKIINVSDFAGYNDKKHPAFFKLRWGSNVLPANSVLYIIKPAFPNGVAIPACIKVKGEYTNTPCIARHAENKKTHKITDTVALLSGDPGGARRG